MIRTINARHGRWFLLFVVPRGGWQEGDFRSPSPRDEAHEYFRKIREIYYQHDLSYGRDGEAE